MVDKPNQVTIKWALDKSGSKTSRTLADRNFRELNQIIDMLDNALLIGLILFLGSVLQGAVGFAYSLFAVPLLVWVGVSLSETVAIMAVSIFVQVLVATYQLRADIRWGDVVPGALIRYVTLPLGIALLIALDTLDTDQVKQILGLILLAVLLVQILWRVEPQEQLRRHWMILAFSCSGILTGMVAMGGPPVVLWAMAHRWPSKQTRAFLVSLFLLLAPAQLLLLYLGVGPQIVAAMLEGLVFAPLVALGSWLGVRLGNLIAKAKLRQIAFGILFVTAFVSVLGPVL